MPAAAGVSLSLADIAARLGGDVLGDPQTLIRQVATLLSAGEGEIGFLANLKYKNQLLTTRAAAVIVSPDFADAVDLPRIVTKNPYAYYARLATLLNPRSNDRIPASIRQRIAPRHCLPVSALGQTPRSALM
jgi:UDP-3-O-[3-hydroxymyristoyl] glucosamine N-acyltransferase